MTEFRMARSYPSILLNRVSTGQQKIRVIQYEYVKFLMLWKQSNYYKQKILSV